ncbi:MAG: hypothetical protein L6R37_005103 [Teloschistes peruensis]|nr:MAG: hypothetical protein L6R37_005103 [Teloschistes peruensis]
MVDVRPPNAYHFPSRKPVAAPHSITNGNRVQQLNRILPDADPSRRQSQSPNSSPYSAYSRASTQTTTSSYHNNAAPLSRRTPSTSTTSTTNTNYGPSRTSSTISNPLSRTSSSRSGQSITSSSYVALMRKQKATVWCDRAQREDPRIIAQQKAAKVRATREIVGGGNTVGRTSTSGSLGSGSLGVRSKIRHHGLQKSAGYSYGNMMGGVGVPLRLSANEVGDEASPQPDSDSGRNVHQRVDSGRSSMASNRWLSTGSQRGQRYSEGSTPTSGAGGSMNGDANIPELEETPVPRAHESSSDYFGSSARGRQSGSSSETEFGQVGQLYAPPAAASTKKEEGKSAEELRRRGSVDERANTMTGVRLFVANPDLSD